MKKNLILNLLKSPTTIRRDPSILVPLAIAIVVLLLVYFLGEQVTGEKQLTIIMSMIALFISAYTLVRQNYAAETSSWNTALMRIGQLYDQAVQDDDLARLVMESVDRDGNQAVHIVQLTSKQDMWLANLFMAFEQIHVAISGASPESQRAWKQFLSNQLNKPTIRRAFLRDVTEFLDYHQDFIFFAIGKATKINDEIQFSGGVIKENVIKAEIKYSRSQAESIQTFDQIEIRPISKEDLPFWKEIYSDPEVQRQMYAVPSDSDEKMFDYFQQADKAAAFTVIIDNKYVAAFTLRKESNTRGTFGIIISKTYRGRGLGLVIMNELEKRAKQMGILTLRADIFSDNIPSIRLIERAGFRPFVWFEKNLK